jgi:hypothetical protein
MTSVEYAVETIKWQNVAATPANFTLRGGNYAFMVNATWGGGSVTLNRLSVDGTTLVPVMTAFSANGFNTQNLPYGTYQLTIATATAVNADLASVATVN